MTIRNSQVATYCTKNTKQIDTFLTVWSFNIQILSSCFEFLLWLFARPIDQHWGGFCGIDANLSRMLNGFNFPQTFQVFSSLLELKNIALSNYIYTINTSGIFTCDSNLSSTWRIEKDSFHFRDRKNELNWCTSSLRYLLHIYLTCLLYLPSFLANNQSTCCWGDLFSWAFVNIKFTLDWINFQYFHVYLSKKQY